MPEEHKVIWLSPSCEDGERTWCSNDEWGECDECGAKPVKYVLAESAPAEGEALREAHAEIQRLQDAKRRALAIADERAKENVALRAALLMARQWVNRAYERCAGDDLSAQLLDRDLAQIDAALSNAPTDTPDEGPDPLGYAKGER